MPPIGSTTTPSSRRSAPHTFSTSSASCVPSTQIREARATFAALRGAAIEPEAVRVGGARRGGRRAPGAGERHGAPLEQEGRRLRGEQPAAAVPVLERHRPSDGRLLPPDDRPAPPARRALDDEVGLADDLGHPGSTRVPPSAQDVGAIAILHAGDPTPRCPSALRAATCRLRCVRSARHGPALRLGRGIVATATQPPPAGSYRAARNTSASSSALSATGLPCMLLARAALATTSSVSWSVEAVGRQHRDLEQGARVLDPVQAVVGGRRREPRSGRRRSWRSAPSAGRRPVPGWPRTRDRAGRRRSPRAGRRSSRR